MLSRSFKPAKCNTSLRLAVSRIKTLRNKRENQLRQMKRDLAQLLATGQEQTARIRVEHYVREEKTLAAYDIIQVYCELIIARMPIIESQKNCSIDLKEAISSVIFASPRCTDIVELVDVRKQFTAKYGKDFISSALELRPDCGVNRTVVEKLSAKTPDGESKIRILTAIAQEHNVKWDPKAFAEQVTKPSEDLLDGPKKFDSSSKMLAESFSAQFQSPDMQFKSANEQFLAPPIQKHDSHSSLSENNATRASPSSNLFSSRDGHKPTTSVSTHLHLQSGASDIRTGHTEVRPPTTKDNIDSFNRHHWNMEFKDAASAAQVAADSAEMASLAARAAAELSRMEKSATHSPKELHRSYREPKDETPVRLTGSKSGTRGNTMEIEDDSENSVYRMQTGLHNKQKDRLEQDHIFRGAESRSDQHESVMRKSSRSVSSQSSSTSIDDEIAVSNPQKDADNISPSRQWKYNPFPNIPSYSYSDIDSNSSPNVHKHASDSFDQNPVSVGFGDTERKNEQSDFGHSSAVVFDQSGSETEDHVELESDYHRSSFPFQETKILSHQSSKMEPCSPSQQFSRSFLRSDGTDQASEGLLTDPVPLEAKDSFPARFDDSDGFSSENEEVGDHTSRERYENISSSREEEISYGNFFSAQSDHGSHKFSAHVKEGGVIERDIFAYASGDVTESGEGNSTGLPPSRFSSTKTEKNKDLRSDNKVQNLKSTARNMSGSSVRMPGVSTGSSFSAQTSYATPNRRKEEAGLPPSRFPSTETEKDNDLRSDNKVQNLKSTERNMSGASVRGVSTGSSFTAQTSYATPNPRKEEAGVVKKMDLLYKSSDDSESDDGRVMSQRSSRLPSGEEVRDLGKEPPSPSTVSSEISSYLSHESVNSLNLGRLRGGLRNKGLTRPPYVKPPSKEESKNEVPSIPEVTRLSLSEKLFAQETKSSGQKHFGVDKKLNSKGPVSDSDSDTDDGEKIQPRRNFNARGQEGGLASRRTRHSPSKSASKGPSGLGAWSRDPVHSGLTEGSKSSQVGLSSKPQIRSVASGSEDNSPRFGSFAKQESKQPQVEIPVEKVEEPQKLLSEKPGASETPNLPTRRFSSRESSLKGASHVHPKLPDYDSLAAHFETLRSNRR
ncbi:uncharacterized protein [Aristolochia californica]|uniref:uncharacterized protein n=1 Tax=Aristolochia californica TaxID=171875 RepID=UPI0035D88A43